MEQYRESTKLFTQAVDQYQEAIDGYQRSVDQYQEFVGILKQDIGKYELLLEEHGIDTSKLKVKTFRQLIPPPPPQFKVIQGQPQSKTPQTKVSVSPLKDVPLPNLKTMKRQLSKSKGVSKNSPLYKELLNLLRGNEETANRLITGQQKLNPDKLENWILEKVVGDLKRDRHV